MCQPGGMDPQPPYPGPQPPYPGAPPAWPAPSQAYAPVPAPLPAAPGRRDTARWAAAGLLGIVGGFVVLSGGVGSQLPISLAGFGGMPLSVVVLQLLQVLFGVAAVVAAYLLAPGRIGMRVVAGVVFVIAAVLSIVFASIRLTGSVDPFMSSVLLNATALLVFWGAVGWLLACGARPIAYLSLLAPLVLLLPIAMWLSMAGVEGAIITLVLQVIALVTSVVVLLASAARSRSLLVE